MGFIHTFAHFFVFFRIFSLFFCGLVSPKTITVEDVEGGGG